MLPSPVPINLKSISALTNVLYSIGIHFPSLKQEASISLNHHSIRKGFSATGINNLINKECLRTISWWYLSCFWFILGYEGYFRDHLRPSFSYWNHLRSRVLVDPINLWCCIKPSLKLKSTGFATCTNGFAFSALGVVIDIVWFFKYTVMTSLHIINKFILVMETRCVCLWQELNF